VTSAFFCCTFRGRIVTCCVSTQHLHPRLYLLSLSRQNLRAPLIAYVDFFSQLTHVTQLSLDMDNGCNYSQSGISTASLLKLAKSLQALEHPWGVALR
jgi:hypothetical protein